MKKTEFPAHKKPPKFKIGDRVMNRSSKTIRKVEEVTAIWNASGFPTYEYTLGKADNDGERGWKHLTEEEYIVKIKESNDILKDMVTHGKK